MNESADTPKEPEPLASTGAATYTSSGVSHHANQGVHHTGRVQVDVPISTVVKVLLSVAAFILIGAILRELSGLMVQLAIAGFLAIAADPLVRKLEQRGFGRGRAILVVMGVVFAVVGAMVAIFVPPLVEQGDKLVKASPGIISDVRSSPMIERLDDRFDLVGTATEQAEKLPALVGDQLTTVVGAVLAGLIGTITILFLTLFLLAGGGQLVRGTVKMLPELTERRWWTIIQGTYTGISAYVGGAIIIALCGGTSLAIMAFLLGLPYALPLGLWMMLLEIIPMIGATIGAIPAVIVAFVAGGPVEGIIMLTFIIVYQQIENIIIQPRVQGRAAALSPLVVFLSVLIGSQLLGVLGALFAVPVAGVLQIAIREIIEHRGGEDVEMPSLIAGKESDSTRTPDLSTQPENGSDGSE